MPIVDTSVAVAMPPITAYRISTGNRSAGKAITKVRPTVRADARFTPARSSDVVRWRARIASPIASTTPGSKPPVNKAAIETPVTDPIAISTNDGGIVSAIAPAEASNDTISPSASPRFFISGNSTGATAAMSAVFDPEIPDTSSIAPSSTYCSPPRTCPTNAARKATMAFAISVISISAPSMTNSGTASRISELMPSSMRPGSTCNGVVVVVSR